MSERLPWVEDLPSPERRQRALGQWYTPSSLARRVVGWAHVREHMRVIEPSAGRGALALEVIRRGARCHCVEVDPANVEHLHTVGLVADCCDWLAWHGRAELVIANPPYEHGAEGTHLWHALEVAPRVVAIVRLQALASMRRWESLWSRCHLSRMAICVRRPAFSASGGGTFDVAVIELVRGSHDQAPTRVEWWTDEW
jgi:predicted RNA methylase